MCFFRCIGIRRRLVTPKQLSRLGVSPAKLLRPTWHSPQFTTKSNRIAKMLASPMKLQRVHAIRQFTSTPKKKQLLNSKLQVQKIREGTSHDYPPFSGGKYSLTAILPYTENFATTLNHKFKQIKKGTGLYILHGSISILNVCALYTYTDKREIHPRAGYSKKTKRGGMFIFMQLSLHVTTNMTKYILIFRATNSRHLSQL